MKIYIRPEIKSFSSLNLTEVTGPAQTAAYLTVDGYKGAFLHQEKMHNYCELKHNGKTSSEIYRINNEGVTNNA